MADYAALKAVRWNLRQRQKIHLSDLAMYMTPCSYVLQLQSKELDYNLHSETECSIEVLQSRNVLYNLACNLEKCAYDSTPINITATRFCKG